MDEVSETTSTTTPNVTVGNPSQHLTIRCIHKIESRVQFHMTANGAEGIKYEATLEMECTLCHTKFSISKNAWKGEPRFQVYPQRQ